MVDSEEPFWKCVAKGWVQNLIVATVCLFVGAGITLFAVLLGFRASLVNPKCSIENFYVPALNKTLDSQLNTTLNFMVRFNNTNEDKGIYYDDVHITISSTNPVLKSIRAGTTNHVTIGNYTMPKFYQGFEKNAKKWVQVVPLNNQTVLRAVWPNGSAVFRLDLKTQVRFKVLFSITKRFRFEVGADVEVNGDGTKTDKKEIKLKKSDSSFPLRRSLLICVFMNLLVFFMIL